MKLYVILTIIVSFFILATIAVVLTTDFNKLPEVSKENKEYNDDSYPSLGNATSFDESVNDFSFNFFKKLNQDPTNTGNIFYSPYSVFTALAMTYEGAHDDTAYEMQQVLKIEQDNKSFHQYMKNLYEYLNKNSKYNISTANALWIKENFHLLDDYINIIHTYYGGESSEIDFSDPWRASDIINQWVENKTNNLIKNLVSPSAIDPFYTRLILTNAIYFKGSWQIQFDEKNTTDSDFITNQDDNIQVKTMQLIKTEDRFNYTETEKLQILELPYNGNEISMLVILPKEGVELSDTIDSIDKNDLSTWIDEMYETELDIYLPKFKVETSYNLNKYLVDLGMKKAFSDKANFSGINRETDLFISSVIHKAYIDVNEEGTEAAAATAVIVGTTSINGNHSTRIVFDADHPFMFIIQHKETGTILFMGKITNPS